MNGNDESVLIGKTIAEIEIDGYGVTIKTEDGYCLSYAASDGGYSCWDIVLERGENDD